MHCGISLTKLRGRNDRLHFLSGAHSPPRLRGTEVVPIDCASCFIEGLHESSGKQEVVGRTVPAVLKAGQETQRVREAGQQGGKFMARFTSLSQDLRATEHAEQPTDCHSIAVRYPDWLHCGTRRRSVHLACRKEDGIDMAHQEAREREPHDQI